MSKPKNIDEYISWYPADVQIILQKIRDCVRKSAPEAEEVISYSLPAFKQNGILVYFGAVKNHIGFYPTPGGIEAFKNEMAEYKFSKGAVQFPFNKPIPYKLIEQIVKYRVKENLTK